jgi:hypothetical protein
MNRERCRNYRISDELMNELYMLARSPRPVALLLIHNDDDQPFRARAITVGMT